jgi:hypothetical protein
MNSHPLNLCNLNPHSSDSNFGNDIKGFSLHARITLELFCASGEEENLTFLMSSEA